MQHNGVIEDLIASDSLAITFHFIGNGPLADRLPIHHHIKHTAFIEPEALPELLHQASFLILPSNYEAWGLVVHEAMLCGLPVISTYESGAAVDFVKDEENGYLFHAKDKQQLKAIFQKINHLSNDEYEALSQNALSASKKVSLDQWSNTINEFGKA